MSTQKLGDGLMKIPTLDVAGLNWVIYKDRFLWSIDARGLLDHVDGSAIEPSRPATHSELSTEDTLRMAEWQKELKAWKYGDAIVKQQIAATIPDSLFMKVRNAKTAFDIWTSLSAVFQNKSRMVAVDL
ncbi:hypothetical protein B0H34DRAFT_638159, partial [Crassisporium funariophilum]